MKVVNPANGEFVGEVEDMTPEQVDDAVARARAAQPDWAARTFAERVGIMRRFQELLVAQRRSVAELVSQETGKPLAEAMAADVLVTLDSAKWLAGNGPRVLSVKKVDLTNPLFLGRTSKLERVPHGVVGVISPWNYPLSLAAGSVLYALMAGNAVVLKPASFTPHTALRLVALLHEAGVPEDALRVVTGPGSTTGDALVEADIDHLAFIGSIETGRQVDLRLRERGISTTMELGGNDAAIVMADARLDDTVRGVIWGRFTNAGQTCAATKRVYVHRSRYDEFVGAATKLVAALRVGDPMQRDTEVGALTDPNGLDDMAGFVADARERGARILTGGQPRHDLPGRFFEPTLLADVPVGARILQEECFGPILPIHPYDTLDEVVREANGTPYGLSASIWASDLEAAQQLARRLEVGTVWINEVAATYGDNAAPWGGEKASGHGRTHGDEGLLANTRIMHIHTNPHKGPSPWWYPYGHNMLDFYEQGAAFLYGGAKDKARTGAGMASNLWRRLRK